MHLINFLYWKKTPTNISVTKLKIHTVSERKNVFPKLGNKKLIFLSIISRHSDINLHCELRYLSNIHKRKILFEFAPFVAHDWSSISLFSMCTLTLCTSKSEFFLQWIKKKFFAMTMRNCFEHNDAKCRPTFFSFSKD